ncbi:MAG: N-acetylmuramoyl-L-alanine amidase [Pseudobutyrivibrio sp.]|nr:N-acetylmuramoyl-L-alanine amidase [Pseudobutyrivibrio sp.]
MPRREELHCIATGSEWYQVQYEDKTGYVSAAYLTTEEPAVNSYVVVIDPGHQGRGDSTTEPNGPGSATMKARVAGGTHGTTTGVYEYELTLAISQQLQTELQNRGYTVYMTRTSHDVNISNMERAQYATSVGADIAVRIHANGAENASVSGAMALAPSSSNPYISYLSGSSWNLSQCVLNSYCQATGMRNQGVTGSDTMTGINWSTVPVTILEMGYMTNPTDDTNMENPSYQSQMVQGIANGIDAYFGL